MKKEEYLFDNGFFEFINTEYRTVGVLLTYILKTRAK